MSPPRYRSMVSSLILTKMTNEDDIESPGLTCLVEALVSQGLYNVHVCAPQSDKSVSGHSITLKETIAVSSVDINGATSYEVSGKRGCVNPNFRHPRVATAHATDMATCACVDLWPWRT